jgi:hypothetical protein
MAISGTKLTTEQFFSSVSYMQNGGQDWLKMRDLVDYDNLNQGVDSLFNHFTTFSYSSNILDKYEPSAHFAGYTFRATSRANLDAANNSLSDQESLLRSNPSSNAAAQRFREDRAAQGRNNLLGSAYNNAFAQIVNPTAQTIIDWGAKASPLTKLGFQPYAWTDFGFCKYYGKIPNNRLITLRRYPFPVDDSLTSQNKASLIPIAQAVTWFGDETGNKLSKIGNFQWNMPWEELSVTQQDIDGNEVTVDDLVGIVSGLGGTAGAGIAEAIKVAIGTKLVTNDLNKMAEVTGTDKKLQEYVKSAYNKDTGPYWNRVYGPVNVIHKSQRRARGVQDQYGAPFTINFHYQFRSFSGLSPKMAALDLISNFLQLTYNNAQFLGQLSRYFQRPGLKFDQTTTQNLTSKLQLWAAGKLTAKQALAEIRDQLLAAGIAAKGSISNVIQNASTEKGIKDLLTTAGTAASVYAGTKAEKLIPNLISIKSALSDRPVGEWHIVVGNPINPIFVMGDLLVTDTKATFDDEIGPEDFPTGITFTVQLKQGKPRDKFAIERMFNSGVVGLGSTKVKASSEEDTFGDENNELYKSAFGSADADQRRAAADELASKSASFSRARDRVGLAYGYRTGTKQTDGTVKVGMRDKSYVDDSLLSIYYKKDFGSN